MAEKAVAFPTGKAAAVFQVLRPSSVAGATENAIDHGANDGNAIAGAFTVAIAVASTAVVDRTVIVDRSAAAVVTATAGADDDTTAAGVAG
jgi:hypothetical protein